MLLCVLKQPRVDDSRAGPNRFMGGPVCGVMVSLLAISKVNLDQGSDPGRVKPKTIQLTCVAFPPSTQH